MLAFFPMRSPDGREAAFLFVGLVAGLGFLAVAGLAMSGIPQQGLDGLTADWAAHQSDTSRSIGKVLDLAGSNPVLIIMFTGLAIVLWRDGRRHEAILLPVAFVALQATVHILKFVLGVPRPGEALVTTSGNGFPSGHTANAAYIAVMLVWFGPRYHKRPLVVLALTLIATVWVGAMGWSRIIVGAHYLADVVGGALLAIAMMGTSLSLTSMRASREIPVESGPRAEAWERVSIRRHDK